MRVGHHFMTVVTIMAIVIKHGDSPITGHHDACWDALIFFIIKVEYINRYWIVLSDTIILMLSKICFRLYVWVSCSMLWQWWQLWRWNTVTLQSPAWWPWSWLILAEMRYYFSLVIVVQSDIHQSLLDGVIGCSHFIYYRRYVSALTYDYPAPFYNSDDSNGERRKIVTLQSPAIAIHAAWDASLLFIIDHCSNRYTSIATG